ncbi:MAG: hypothetical protein PHG30_00980 [Eubacteriales bacterium]|nr:hypothetical protein [Eubacteriales bacterium]
MTLNELISDLDMDGLSPVEYFEQIAALLEHDKPIPYDLFFSILSQTPTDELGEWLALYFDELFDNIPDAGQELFALLESIRQQLALLWRSPHSAEARLRLIEELHRFKHWYTKPDAVGADGTSCSVLEALTLYRARSLGEPEHTFRFDACLEYPLDTLSLPLGAFEPIDIEAAAEADPEE